MRIDWSFLDAVNWAEVAWLSALAFLATLIGEMVRHWFWAAILAGVLFAAGASGAVGRIERADLDRVGRILDVHEPQATPGRPERLVGDQGEAPSVRQ